MKNLKTAPNITLYLLFFFLFYLSAVKHIEVLLCWLFIVIAVILIFSKKRCDNLKSALDVTPFIVMVLLPFFIRGFANVPADQRNFSIKLILRLTCAIMTISFILGRYSYLYLVEGVMKLGLPNFLNQIIALTFRYFFMVRNDVDKAYNAMRSRGFTSEIKFKPEKIDSPFYILLIVFSVAFLLALTVFERFAELPWLF